VRSRHTLRTIPRIQANAAFLNAVRDDKRPLWQIASAAGFRYPQILSVLLHFEQPYTALAVGRFNRIAEVVGFKDAPFEIRKNTTEEISADNGVESARSM
jgi:hypothetical protein